MSFYYPTLPVVRLKTGFNVVSCRCIANTTMELLDLPCLLHGDLKVVQLSVSVILRSYTSPDFKPSVTARLPNGGGPMLNLPRRLVQEEKWGAVEDLVGTQKAAGTLSCHVKTLGSSWSGKYLKMTT